MSSMKSASGKAGLSPGSLIHIGRAEEAASRISVLHYNQQTLEKSTITAIEEVLPNRAKDGITWVSIEGLKDVGIIESIGRHFNIHPLVLEDILNTHQRPKFEEFADYLFIVLKGLSFERSALAIGYEQISILVLKNVIFTFREKQSPFFEPIMRRFEDSNGRLRTRGADYLAYAIVDMLVDQYFTLQDELDEAIESVEARLLSNPTSLTLAKIQRLRRELVVVRKSISPIRELLSGMARSESDIICEKTRPYLRDVYDHAIRVTEAVDSSRELITGMLDIYLSSVSNKMNEVMKVLTAFASIFIPLTFLVGIYGMNFEYMPELKWKWAYPALWLVFIGITIGLLAFFKRKKWL